MARTASRVLPFRIPFFRIVYSTTYTTVYLVCLCFLAITPVSMLWQAITQVAYQYVVMIGGTYLLTSIAAIIIYASRLYTNRTIMAGLGKAYLPVEPGEVVKSVRKMIVIQLERSAIIAWESRPRDLLGEILQAEQSGFLPPETMSVGRDDYTVGREIPLDPSSPPWGDVQHAGWSSPAHKDGNDMPNVHFAPVIQELPNLVEAKAVSLAPPDPATAPIDGNTLADPVVADILRRPETMGMRDYLTQLSYLGLMNPPEVGQVFLKQYESARFGGLPISEAEFKSLMSAFADLLSGMTNLSSAIVEQIRLQAGDRASVQDDGEQSEDSLDERPRQIPASSPRVPGSSIIISPRTAPTAPSSDPTAYLTQQSRSKESVIQASHGSAEQQASTDVQTASPRPEKSPSTASSSLASDQSDSGSVLRHRSSPEDG